MENRYNAAMKSDKRITAAQLRMLHVQLRNSGIISEKKEIISEYTNGRTDSSRELTINEANDLLRALCRNDSRQNEIKAIWHLAYEMGFIYGSSRDDRKMNSAKLDSFCLSRGTVKKPINKQSLIEVRRTHRQFERMYSTFCAKKSKSNRIAQIEKLIAELSEKEDYESCANLKKELNQLKTKV